MNRERSIVIPMPWKKRMYCLATDYFGVHRPFFGIFWEWLPGCLKIRMGWGSKCAGLHECRDDMESTKIGKPLYLKRPPRYQA